MSNRPAFELPMMFYAGTQLRASTLGRISRILETCRVCFSCRSTLSYGACVAVCCSGLDALSSFDSQQEIPVGDAEL